MSAEDFEKWLDGVPVVEVGGAEFDGWLDGAPVVQPGSDDTVPQSGRRWVTVSFTG